MDYKQTEKDLEATFNALAVQEMAIQANLRSIQDEKCRIQGEGRLLTRIQAEEARKNVKEAPPLPPAPPAPPETA